MKFLVVRKFFWYLGGSELILGTLVIEGLYCPRRRRHLVSLTSLKNFRLSNYRIDNMCKWYRVLGRPHWIGRLLVLLSHQRYDARAYEVWCAMLTNSMRLAFDMRTIVRWRHQLLWCMSLLISGSQTYQIYLTRYTYCLMHSAHTRCVSCTEIFPV